MNLTKDTYEYLLNFADDRDVINMLSVNRKFNDEVLFEKIMRKRYPELIGERKKNESWKNLFIRIVYYIALLDEEFHISYFPGLNIVSLFTETPAHSRTWEILIAAAREGNLEVIKLLKFNRGTVLFDKIVAAAAIRGHLNIIQFLLPKDPSLAKDVAMRAAENGHLRIINYILSWLTDEELHLLLKYAKNNNKIEIVDRITRFLNEDS